MGGLRERMPITFWVYLVGALALSGIARWRAFSPRMRSSSRQARQPGGLFHPAVAAFLTAFYMGRQIFLVFTGHRAPAPPGRPVKTAPSSPSRWSSWRSSRPWVGRSTSPGSTPWSTGWSIPSRASTRRFNLYRGHFAAGGSAGLGLAYLVYGRQPAQRPQA